MKTAFELAQIINPNPNEFDIKLVNGIIAEYKSEIIKEIDNMIGDCKTKESKYYLEGNKDAELQHWNRRQSLTELKQKIQ